MSGSVAGISYWRKAPCVGCGNEVLVAARSGPARCSPCFTAYVLNAEEEPVGYIWPSAPYRFTAELMSTSPQGCA